MISFFFRYDLKNHLQDVHTKELCEDSSTNESNGNNIITPNGSNEGKAVEKANRNMIEEFENLTHVFDIGGTEELEVRRD